ncbi:hypothetical protein ABXS75_10900 [Roseburia hominis]
MITFIGSPEKSYFAESVAQQYKEELNLIPASSDIMNQERRILAVPCSYMIFDLDQYTNPPYVLATEILKLKNSNNAKVIIFAPGMSEESTVIREFKRYGINLYIFTLTLGERKEELRAILAGEKYQKDDSAIESGDTQKQVIIKTNLKSIAVAGVMTRTGTTTQAVQIVKYLLAKGYHACYIEANQSDFVKRIAEWYSDEDCQIEERLDARGMKQIFKIRVNGLDMFCNMDFLSEILTLNYDYFVYDYGVYTSRDFNKISYSEKNIKIMTCGAEPDELDQTKNIMGNVFYDNIHYIFTFVPEQDQEEVRLLMEEKADHTFFAPYVPDRFLYSGDEMYEKLFPLEQKQEEEPNAKKRGWFLTRRRKHGKV